MKIRLVFSLAVVSMLVPGCSTTRESAADSDEIAAALAVGLPALAKQTRREVLAVLPDKPKGNNLFDVYTRQGDSAWARNWTRKLDFTGVAWDDPRTATLISPRHVVMAAHFVRPVGDPIVFHDKRGRKVLRILTAVRKVPNIDIAVGLLESEPGVTHYRILAPAEDHAQTLVGGFAFITDQERRLHAHEIRAIGGNAIAFKHSAAIHKAWWEKLIAGDSGNPSFLLVNGELLLLGTHSIGGPGAGPFYASPFAIAGINEAMRELGGGGYQLSLAPNP